jgi:choline dehydrogenase
VFPKIPGTFIVLPIYMISEKATDTILESLGETRKDANFP